MNYWNLAYDYAALFVLLLVVIWYFGEKRIPRQSHKVFLMLLGTIFSSIGIKVIATQMAGNMLGSDSLFVILMSMQFFASNMVAVIFSVYLLLISHYRIKDKKLLCLLYCFIIGADVIITLLNPILNCQFTIENSVLNIGYAGHLMYIFNAVLICFSILVTIRNRKRIQTIPVIPFVFIIFLGIVAFVGQIYFHTPNLNLVLVAICMTVFHYQQNAGTVTDAVTGLFSRRFMGEFLREQFIDGNSFGVITVSMDDFKFINKTYGVESGDHLLFQVGQFLKQAKGSEYVFRFGSDQFCVIIKKDLESLGDIAGQIMERFRHPWYDESQSAIMMSASICCMECPRDASSYGELIELIDYSMSVAKKTRKGRITSAGEIDTDKIKQDKTIEKAVRLALDRDDIMVYYQPIFSVEKNAYNSAEALVRLHDEELGWVSPEDFIPIAEKNGLIIEMGEMILEKVCRFIRDFNIKDTTVEYIEVNISPLQLVQVNFADRVKQILEKYQVEPHQINIEITETATLGAAAVINKNISSLLDYGITFSLDDYGSGNANIDYINRMPFKIIKIDKCIIWDSFKNTKAGITLEYTIGMLNALKLNIVAEGVETEEMRQQLMDFGCHYMQGWLYSKAVPDTEFVELLAAQGM